jgi:hypothetical protein
VVELKDLFHIAPVKQMMPPLSCASFLPETKVVIGRCVPESGNYHQFHTDASLERESEHGST